MIATFLLLQLPEFHDESCEESSVGSFIIYENVTAIIDNLMPSMQYTVQAIPSNLYGAGNARTEMVQTLEDGTLRVCLFMYTASLSHV